MNLLDYVKLLRTRWITVCATTLAAVLVAVAYTLTTTPQYQASTQLYVSTSAGSSMTDLYQGNRLSQERVLSYTQLLMGQTVAQRTIDKLGLNMSANTLSKKVKASAKLNTVLIDVSVLDASPARASDIANTLSNEFVSLVGELETSQKMGGSPDARVVVVQQASAPTKPVTPNKSRNLLLGLMAGFLLGAGLALVRDRLDNTVKDRETLERITGVGLVGNIPLDKDLHKEPATSFESNSSAAAESFRKLRTNLQFLAVDNPPEVIVVTSSSPGEGKSTTAINIALVLAEAEHNVVLVDGDMRRPSVDKYLDLVGTVGLSTVLSGAASLPEVLQKTAFPNLTALTAGATPPNPSELLGSQAAKNVLNELRDRFDYVIVDSPPLLAVTDGAVLSANSDGALIMSRYGHTKRELLTHAIGTLQDVGATVLGAVFTMTPSRGGGRYSYHYNYYYGPDRPDLADKSPANADTSGSTTEAIPATPGHARVNGAEVAEPDGVDTEDTTKSVQAMPPDRPRHQ